MQYKSCEQHYQNITEPSERASECLCLFVCLCACEHVYLCVCVCMDVWNSYQVIRLPIQSIILPQCSSYLPWIFSRIFYWLLCHTETCYLGQTFEVKKRTERRLECFEYIFYLFFASRLWLHFNEVYRWTFACSLPASLPSSAIPLSPTINFCLSPYSCFLPFNLSPEKNVPSVHSVGWYRKGTRTARCVALYSFWSFDHYWQYSILTEVSAVCLSQCISFKSLSAHTHKVQKISTALQHKLVSLLGVYLCGVCQFMLVEYFIEYLHSHHDRISNSSGVLPKVVRKRRE